MAEASEELPRQQKLGAEASEELLTQQKLGGYLVMGFSFFIANVNDGFGPIQTVYLVVAKEWGAGPAGVIWMIRELSTMACAVPLGHLLDNTRNKRMLISALILTLSVANVSIVFSEDFWFLAVRAFVAGVTGTSIRPGMASLTLGIVGSTHFDRWAARCQVANFAGATVALLASGIATWMYYPQVECMFIVFGAFGLAGVFCVLLIPPSAIDFDRARGAKQTKKHGSPSGEGTQSEDEALAEAEKAVSYKALLTDKNIMLWNGMVFLLHFSNAAVLPLLGQVVGAEGGRDGMLWACSLIVIASFVALAFGTVINKLAVVIGWKGVILVGWGINVPRIALILVAMKFFHKNQILLASSQIFDGVGACANGMIGMVVTAIITEGSGRFGAATGLMNMSWQAGVALGNVVFGYLADQDYALAFLVCGLLGTVPLLGLPCLRLERFAAAAESDEESSESGTDGGERE